MATGRVILLAGLLIAAGANKASGTAAAHSATSVVPAAVPLAATSLSAGDRDQFVVSSNWTKQPCSEVIICNISKEVKRKGSGDIVVVISFQYSQHHNDALMVFNIRVPAREANGITLRFDDYYYGYWPFFDFKEGGSVSIASINVTDDLWKRLRNTKAIELELMSPEGEKLNFSFPVDGLLKLTDDH